MDFFFSLFSEKPINDDGDEESLKENFNYYNNESLCVDALKKNTFLFLDDDSQYKLNKNISTKIIYKELNDNNDIISKKIINTKIYEFEDKFFIESNEVILPNEKGTITIDIIINNKVLYQVKYIFKINNDCGKTIDNILIGKDNYKLILKLERNKITDYFKITNIKFYSTII